MSDVDEISSTDSEGNFSRTFEGVLNGGSEPFSLETNIENVVKLQNLLQIEKHRFHKEQRSRIFLENIKTSIEADNINLQKKIDILSKEKLYLEKNKIELELRIKHLQLLLTEEKGKRMNAEEHLRIVKGYLYNNEKLANLESHEIEVLNFSQDSNKAQCLEELKSRLIEQEMIFKGKELQWSFEKEKYQQEILEIKNDLKIERCSNKEHYTGLISEVQELQKELKGQQKIFHDEQDKLLSKLNLKDQELHKLREQDNFHARRLEGMVPVDVFEDLKNEKNILAERIQEKEKVFNSLREEIELLNFQLKMTSDVIKGKDNEFIEVMSLFTSEKETNSRLEEENRLLDVQNLSLKSNEERLQQKIKLYEEINKSNGSVTSGLDSKIEDMRKSIELVDSHSQHQILLFQKEKLDLQNKLQFFENGIKEAKMEQSIVNEQLKISEENCKRFLKELQISDERNILIAKENETLQRKLHELTEESTRKKTSQGHVKNLMHAMKNFGSQSIEMGLENVMNILKANNAKLKTVLGQKEKEMFEPLDLKTEDFQDKTNSRVRGKGSHNFNRPRGQSVKFLSNMREIIEIHYQLQLNQKLSKLNDCLEKHALDSRNLEDILVQKDNPI